MSLTLMMCLSVFFTLFIRVVLSDFFRLTYTVVIHSAYLDCMSIHEEVYMKNSNVFIGLLNFANEQTIFKSFSNWENGLFPAV
jgi:hypothetical protein